MLGVYWDTALDVFVTKVNLKKKPNTRRGLLSNLSSIFDVIGYLQPYIVPVKKLMQKLCTLGIGWDEEIPETERVYWESWQQDLPNLEKISINRAYIHSELGKVVRKELHVFCDASEIAYAAVCYLRLENTRGDVQVSFVMGRARISPIRSISITRLELAAAVLGVRLRQFVQQELDWEMDQTVFWSDSMSVLQYINNRNRRFYTYVANRVAVIHEGSKPSDWRHIDGKNQSCRHWIKGSETISN